MTPVNIAFKRFAFLVMLADFMDVMTSIVVSSTGIYSVPVRYIFNTLDCALTTLSAYAFIYYIYAYSNIKKASMIRRKWIIRVLLFIYFAILLTNPITGEMKSSRITVLSKFVENHDVVKYYRNASVYSIKLLDNHGKVDSGKTITFNINGVFYHRTTDVNGIARLNLNLGLGKYIITAEYGGLMVSNNIEILSIIESNNLVMKFHDGSKFHVKLLDGYGKPYPNKSVSFNINGIFYERSTNIDGIASLNINLQKGQYIITSMYNGLCVSNTIKII